VKPARFSYHAPTTVPEVLDLLGEDSKILAGGQSLVPAMSFRLARPATLVDLNKVAGLDRVQTTGDVLVVGALVRHREFEEAVEPGPLGRLLSLAARKIGHLPIRIRGTFAGSLAHADPAAEWCTIFRTLDGEVVTRATGGSRTIPAASFFHTVFTTDLRPDEMIEQVRLPVLGPDHRVGFSEFSRRAGDFALVMASTVLRMDGEIVVEARIGIGGARDVPVRAGEAEQALVGRPLDDASIADAADAAARSIRPLEDIHASLEYRRDLIRAMTRRALAGAT
jgi:carbon-monoxide dehydrogenase medium subunit